MARGQKRTFSSAVPNSFGNLKFRKYGQAEKIEEKPHFIDDDEVNVKVKQIKPSKKVKGKHEYICEVLDYIYTGHPDCDLKKGDTLVINACGKLEKLLENETIYVGGYYTFKYAGKTPIDDGHEYAGVLAAQADMEQISEEEALGNSESSAGDQDDLGL